MFPIHFIVKLSKYSQEFSLNISEGPQEYKDVHEPFLTISHDFPTREAEPDALLEDEHHDNHSFRSSIATISGSRHLPLTALYSFLPWIPVNLFQKQQLHRR